MFTRGSRWLGIVCVMSLVLAGFGTDSTVRADDNADNQANNADIQKKVAAHLDAGEFGVAAQLLGGMNNNNFMQQMMMAQMAQAAMMNGNRNNFANGMGGMNNSAMRTNMLQNMTPQFGPPKMGGAAMADFEPLMDLMKSTTGMPKPGWVDDGGVGTVKEFRSGVYVDNSGILRRVSTEAAGGSLSTIRKSALQSSGNRDVRKQSEMRKVSLTRLERACQLKRALGKDLDETMQAMAGLQRVKYVLIYPETGDLVLVGPAGDWTNDVEGRLVGVEGGRPVLQLDDLVVLLRAAQNPNVHIGCSIDPRAENIAKMKEFLEESSKQPLKPGQRERDNWLAKIRGSLGKQDISVFGLDPRTRVAQVMVEADYRMKLVGMGLEEGVLGVKSYLDSVNVGPDGSPPAMSVLRWWFAVNYDAIKATEAHDAFEIKGQGVKVLSENEMLKERGERVHTGQADGLNAEFASSFTKHFPKLAQKYPVYAELQNVFDLALVAALIHSNDLSSQVNWPQSYFNEPSLYRVKLGTAPKEVETVINHRVINRKHIVAGVSGGVTVDLRGLVEKENVKTDTYGALKATHQGSSPKQFPVDMWWWD